MQTAKALGMRTIAVYSEADADALHVAEADQAFLLGPAPANESYLKGDRIIEIAKEAGAECIHPGYGFLSENADFAEACEKAGITFVGPSADSIRAMGLKDAAKRLMEEAGVPVVPGYHGDNQDAAHLAKEADKTGYPVLIKAVAGGGGKGMRRVDDPKDFTSALEGAIREGEKSFGDGRVLIEKFIEKPRHIEIQVFADSHGDAVFLFERDCSLQRRHQKVVEEAPAPGMPEDMREAMGAAAVAAAKAVTYRGAGTVEFITDASKGLSADAFWFMEMNTRLQVEHPVTEEITGQDLVEWQFKVAAGEELPLEQHELFIEGHAIEVRLYAENPAKKFLPSTGTLQRLKFPAEDGHIRIETGVTEGDEISIYYDPMIAKVVAWDATRERAINRLESALRKLQVAGVTTNAAFLAECVDHPSFRAGDVDTGFIDKHMSDLVPQDAAPGPVDQALAAIAVLCRRQGEAEVRAAASTEPASPWDALDGFRVGGVSAERIAFTGDHGFDVGVTYAEGDVTLSVGDETFDVEGELSDDGLSAVIDGVHHAAGVLWMANRLVLMHGGRTFDLPLEDPLAAEFADDVGAAGLAAPMPGKIVSVLASPGEKVKRGQPIVVLEAMKMEHTLAAPADTEIEAVNVAAGDQVAEGAAVVTFVSA
jgi:3-methylcrotonyl-CoA carboxylase alpha subunit